MCVCVCVCVLNFTEALLHRLTFHIPYSLKIHFSYFFCYNFRLKSTFAGKNPVNNSKESR